jgi:3-methyladenine DNA glycosylase AlkD
MTVDAIRARVRSLGDPDAARAAARYFKTGPGQYAEGDLFVGLRAATLRQLAREYRDLPPEQAVELLQSPVHEDRSLALLILADAATRGDAARKKQVYDLYLAHTRFVNNWDLVDVSAAAVVGGHLAERSRRPLVRLAKSASLWERRIAIVATQHFIRRGEFADTLAVAELLLGDREDLIHKAVGWMLREVGQRDRATLEGFLRRHHRRMPRTALRYAIERFPEDLRRAYLSGDVAEE